MQVTKAMTGPLTATGNLAAAPAAPGQEPARPTAITIETRPARDTASLGAGAVKKSQTSTLSLGGAAATAREAVDGARAARDTAAEVGDELAGASQAWRELGRKADGACDKAADALEDGAGKAASKVPLAGGLVKAYDAVTGTADLASGAVEAVRDPAKVADAAIARVAEDPTGALQEAKDAAVELKELGEATLDTAKAGYRGGKQVVQNVAAEGLTGGLKASAKQAGASVARQAGEAAGAAKGLVAKATGKAVAKEVAEVAVKEGAEALAKTAGKAAAKAGAKGLARFAPGVNVAMAAIDTAHAVQVCNDPKATGWQKGCACVTAAGSVLAATNIPVVSQVGAAVSIVTGVAEAVDPKAVAGAVRGAASKVASWFGW